MLHLRLFSLMTLVLLLVACAPLVPATTPGATPLPPGDSTVLKTPEAAELQHLDVGVGFIPNVQFAPFYVAQAKGFYAEEGLDVALEYGFENDFVALTAQGSRQFAVASGDQVILARAQGLPLVYVMKWYERFPVGVMALAETGIDSPEELAQRKVGIPGLFGATFVGWKALVHATGLDEASLELVEIGFTQAAAVSEKQVDAALVYLANEPIQLSEAGLPVNVIEVSAYIDLVSNGLVTNETIIEENPELIRKLARGTLRGLAYTIERRDEAFEIVRDFVPEITDADASIQRLVLERSIELWQSDQPGLSSAAAWQNSADFMFEAGLIEAPLEVDKLYTNEFVE